MIDVFGTLGPSCRDEQVLSSMFVEGMTGIRINLSHVMLQDCLEDLDKVKRAAADNKIVPKILIDMQGPELRIGKLDAPISLNEGDELVLEPAVPDKTDTYPGKTDAHPGKTDAHPGDNTIILDKRILEALEVTDEILLDDGKIAATIIEAGDSFAKARITRGGILNGKKSIAIVGKSVDMPALTDSDIENIRLACKSGIYGVMQPFVRSADDLKMLRSVLDDNGGKDIKIYAKIENTKGVDNLESFFEVADEIIIARGDLGNAVPLWTLPGVQKDIAARCNKECKPFMVVTQMLSSMEHSKVPTRAEVSDIYNAVLDGAASVMVTGETAVGEYPADVIRYMRKTVEAAEAGSKQ
ncbi:pyruvate kinase [Butyrivibrio sp. VCB2001]|uniref:pyruvate kinase n=1 Tax=Butyrivibrio sp. VCB2001 TaxID=1280667 RepID=UPI00056D0304|nr:pyruvate kinase [Butyrivibrio sp. VCB2001]